MEDERIIVNLSKEDRLACHVPDEIYRLARDNEVFVRDEKTDKLIQILDFTRDGEEKGAPEIWLNTKPLQSAPTEEKPMGSTTIGSDTES
jgi:hypothetical protein